MEGWMNLYDAGVCLGPQNDAIFEGSGFLGSILSLFHLGGILDAPMPSPPSGL